MEMNVLERKKKPPLKKTGKINIKEAVKYKMDNGLPVYVIEGGIRDVIQIELIFNAGIRRQPLPLVASATNSMLTEGTKSFSSNELAEKLDYYGAFINQQTGPDFAYVSLFCLNKYLAETLPVLADIIKNAVFHENEFEVFIRNKKQDYMIDAEKVSYLAQKKFGEAIFGKTHAYGYNVVPEDFDNLTPQQLKEFHADSYNAVNCKIICSGKVSKEITAMINEYFGKTDRIKNTINAKREEVYHEPQKSEKTCFIQKDDSLQSAVMIGRILFNRLHPDFMLMKVLNTVLGGYFGSRLMANIREDKGYTYGIYSSVVPMQNTGYFVISTETGSDVCDLTIKAIYNELKRLKTKPIPNEELKRVKNYMTGAFLRSIDGPFKLADNFKQLLENGLGYDYHYTFLDTIRSSTPKQLQELANKYFDETELVKVVAGKR